LTPRSRAITRSGPLRIDTETRPASLRKRLARWAPWSVLVEFSNGVTTGEFERLSPFNDAPLWKISRFEGAVPFSSLSDVLDVGCNVGYNAIHLARTYDARCVGIDVQQRHIEAAGYLAELAGVDCRFQIGHAESLVQPEGFDLVLHFGTLYHLPDPLAGLRAAWEHLRPGGWLCLETQTYDDPTDERHCYWLHGLNDDPSNFFALSTPAVRETLTLLGFADVEELERGATPVGEREHMYRVSLVGRKVAGPPLEERWPPWPGR
jgi:SAM-dependent methyltransferase